MESDNVRKVDVETSPGQVMLLDGGRTASGLPMYWSWQPARLAETTRAKFAARRARGYRNPPLRTPAELDDLLGQDHHGPKCPRLSADDRDQRLLLGDDWDLFPRRRIRALAGPFASTRRVWIDDDHSVPVSIIVVIGLAFAMVVLLPGHLAVAIVLSAVLCGAVMLVGHIVRWWVEEDPLRLALPDLTAVREAFELICLPASAAGSPEYELVARAVAAYDAIVAADGAAADQSDRLRVIVEDAVRSWQARATTGGQDDIECVPVELCRNVEQLEALVMRCDLAGRISDDQVADEIRVSL